MDSLLPLIDRLLQVVKQPLMEESDQQTEADHIRQMGLYNLKLLCKLLGAQHPGEFQQVRGELHSSVILFMNACFPVVPSEYQSTEGEGRSRPDRLQRSPLHWRAVYRHESPCNSPVGSFYAEIDENSANRGFHFRVSYLSTDGEMGDFDDFDVCRHDMVLVCGLTALHRVLVSLPNFISPYVSDLLLLVCFLFEIFFI